MAKHNYSQYSNKKNDNKIEAVPEVIVETQNENVTENVTTDEVTVTTIENTTVTDTDVVVTTIENKTTTEAESAAVAKGIVANCAKLNVRSKPITSADVVTVLNVGDEISIDVDKSNKEWYKIRTADGVKGYCMRKFVNANI